MFTDVHPEVGNLPYSTSWQDLKDHMRKAGDVLFCEILQEPGTATGMGSCDRRCLMFMMLMMLMSDHDFLQLPKDTLKMYQTVGFLLAHSDHSGI
jgi:RNA recognition motif-containing protein